MEHGQRVTELMKQKQYSPQSIGEMAVVLYAANEGFLKDISVDKIGDFESALLAYFNSECTELMNTINSTGGYNDEIQQGINKGLEAFKATQTW